MVDDTTLVIKFVFPAPAFLVSLADTTAAVVSDHDVRNELAQCGCKWELLNATGPYKVEVH